MQEVIRGLKGVRCYIDDLVIFSDCWTEHVRQLRELFSRLTGAQLTVNLAKSVFGQIQVTFLGHVIGQGKVAPVNAKVEAIDNYPVPKTRKEVMRFVGMVTFSESSVQICQR
ncbi:hypothetical protein OTU49_004559 [Cherax quadricarinatus]|uniref:Reverse transcriptase domain-containing protein n=1 Tax=Cherax quadricarinatus TaxID=27406 RepID=A0AAW0WZT9_CHEQU